MAEDGLIEVTTVQKPRDDALAELLLNTNGLRDLIRYDHLRSRWLWWNGVRWQPDETKHVNEMIRLRTNTLWEAAQGGEEGTERKMLLPLYDSNRKKSVLEALSSRDDIAMRGDEWDTDPYLLGFDNGIMDLRTGEFDRKPSPALLVSKTVGCDYVENAPCDTFDAFMESIFPGDEATKGYVLCLLGYSLFGLQSEQKFWMWTGRGSNGKGILARTMTHVLGDYADTPSDSMYMRTKVGTASSNQARPDLIRLQGKRFTYMSEPPGKQFNEELLKAHTGEDMILARNLYAKAEQMAKFSPTHTIIFLTNDPPATEDVGVSMRRRARLIRFEEDFTGKRANFKLEEKIKAEKAGILDTLVRWAGMWFASEHGLPEPETVTKWSNEYINENDPLARWIESNCDREYDLRGKSALLYGDYQHWSALNGEEAMGTKSFSQLLAKRYRRSEVRGGSVFHGIDLKPIEQRADDEETDD